MLGEINLVQWRCLAELIDNAVDNFLASQRAGLPIETPGVWITIPTADDHAARVSVRDNGSGMSPDQLEEAVRAGWSGNDPIGSLGLFGMGFNIATARLGTRTKVWTTRAADAEWCGLEIDFETLIRQRHFRTPKLSRPKQDSSDHGTEVTVENLKVEQRQWFAKAANRTKTARDLGRSYSAMLRPVGVPTHFALNLNGVAVPRRDLCTWSIDRFTERPGLGPVHAVQAIDFRLAPRKYCKRCWQWLAASETICPGCGRDDEVVERERRVHGWIGLQRYLSVTDYGLDFLRHGRKIEMDNRDLFSWASGPGEVEPEYPIDDPRNRGRIVGEIHIDHCRVTYMKDRFDRNDPAWAEMLVVVRGDGPLQPDKARELGSPENTSPLYRLFQAYRRSTPKPKVAGSYAKLLVIPDNDRAQEMARKFYDGEAAYQDDGKWWELVEAADRALLTPPSALPSSAGGSLVLTPTQLTSGEPQPAAAPSTIAAPVSRKPLPTLTREYREEITNMRFDVHAFDCELSDPGLRNAPWAMRSTPSGVREFLVNTTDDVFKSATMTPLDALLGEIAWQVMDFQRGLGTTASFASVVAGLREHYAGALKLDPIELNAAARQTMSSIAKSIAGRLSEEDAWALFREMPVSEQDGIHARMATRSVKDPDRAVAEGHFLEFASSSALRRFFEAHPEFFFDGHYWDEPFRDTYYQTPAAVEEARGRLVAYFSGLISDAIWLADQDPDDLAPVSRDRLLRAALALDLLEPTGGSAPEVSG
jgi:histidine kinase/DNA gyrase B/HSP90-like ATPase